MAVKTTYFFGSYSSGYDPNHFIIEIDTDITGTGTTTGSGQFQVWTGGSYSVVATNEDGVTVDNLGSFSGNGDKTFTFSKGGKWVLEFSNGIERIQFNNDRDRAKLLQIRQWGTAQWTSFQNAYFGCLNMNVIATDVPDVSSVSNFGYGFAGCTSLTALDASNWDVSSVVNFNYAFLDCTSLNTLDVSNWNVSSVANMIAMFTRCTSLTTLDVSNWVVSSVVNMQSMFQQCTSLNTLDVSNWVVSSVTNMASMFRDCASLTTLGGVSNWDVSSVTNMLTMFQNCSNLTSDIDFSDPITGSINLTNINGMMAGTNSEKLLLQAGNLLSPTNIAGNPSNWIASPNMKEVKLIGMKNDVDTTVGLGSAGAMTGEAWLGLLESFDISQSKTYKLSPTAYSDMETYIQGLGYADIPDYLVSTGNNWTVIS